MADGHVLMAGDSCAMLEFAATIDPATSGRCAAIGAAIRAKHLPGLGDIVPAYNTVAVHFDPLEVSRETVMALLQESLQSGDIAFSSSRFLEVPVVYGGAAGPDLAAVAEFGGCTEEEVVRLHAEPVYHVYMLGFLPGFAYMGSVDARIAAPRLVTPRVKVSGGSVGIAGRQTGVYPLDSPGGWQIIGRTDLTTFDPSRAEPFLFAAGDRVKFVPVSSSAG